ncbi:class I glutamine amidotransferase-like protein [Xylariaceae sp. AK1471]|nr:class I glutamine amidotransferase-like protein [Xylariaceae sp. AK1471]
MSIFTEINKVAGAPDGRRVIRIGVFIPTECQLLDAAGIDIFGSMSYEYLSVLDKLVPKAVTDSAPSVQIHYIGSVQAGDKIPMTSNQSVVATNHYSDPEVAPGKLDIVYVPGPDPFAEFPQGALEWLRKQAATEGVDILSVCSGIFLCGAAGLLKGKDICGPRGMQEAIVQRGYEPKSMRGHELRWIQDGHFWSSGGVTNGNDLVAAYCRATPKYFPRSLVELVCEQLDVGDRPQEYLKEMTMEKHIGELIAASGEAAKAAA